MNIQRGDFTEEVHGNTTKKVSETTNLLLPGTTAILLKAPITLTKEILQIMNMMLLIALEDQEGCWIY